MGHSTPARPEGDFSCNDCGAQGDAVGVFWVKALVDYADSHAAKYDHTVTVAVTHRGAYQELVEADATLPSAFNMSEPPTFRPLSNDQPIFSKQQFQMDSYTVREAQERLAGPGADLQPAIDAMVEAGPRVADAASRLLARSCPSCHRMGGNLECDDPYHRADKVLPYNVPPAAYDLKLPSEWKYVPVRKYPVGLSRTPSGMMVYDRRTWDRDPEVWLASSRRSWRGIAAALFPIYWIPQPEPIDWSETEITTDDGWRLVVKDGAIAGIEQLPWPWIEPGTVADTMFYQWIRVPAVGHDPA